MQFDPQNTLFIPYTLKIFLANADTLVAYQTFAISTDSCVPMTKLFPGINCKKLGFGVFLVLMKREYCKGIKIFFNIIIIKDYNPLQYRYKSVKQIQIMSKNCFRIAGSKSLPPINQPSPQKLTERIIKDKQYLYIDINEQNGLNLMESIDPQDIELDAEKIGQNYICNLKQLSGQTQKTIDYIYKLHDLRNIKQKYKDLLRDQIGKSKVSKVLSHSKILQEREKRKKSYKKKAKQLPNKERKKRSKTLRENVLFYKGGENGKEVLFQKISQLTEKKGLQNRNKIIFQKERNLISKYGMTNQYQTILNPNLKSTIVRRNGKVFLPQINSVSQFNIS